MAFLCNFNGRSVFASMSVEFEAQLDGSLVNLLSLLKLEDGEGRLFKCSKGCWHASPPLEVPVVFEGGWDALDVRAELDGTDPPRIDLYFAGARHLELRKMALAVVNPPSP